MKCAHEDLNCFGKLQEVFFKGVSKGMYCLRYAQMVANGYTLEGALEKMDKNNPSPGCVYAKLYSGESLTDEELICGYKHFKKLYELMKDLGARFMFARREALEVYCQLNNFYRVRHEEIGIDGIEEKDG